MKHKHILHPYSTILTKSKHIVLYVYICFIYFIACMLNRIFLTTEKKTEKQIENPLKY